MISRPGLLSCRCNKAVFQCSCGVIRSSKSQDKAAATVMIYTQLCSNILLPRLSIQVSAFLCLRPVQLSLFDSFTPLQSHDSTTQWNILMPPSSLHSPTHTLSTKQEDLQNRVSIPDRPLDKATTSSTASFHYRTCLLEPKSSNLILFFLSVRTGCIFLSHCDNHALTISTKQRETWPG